MSNPFVAAVAALALSASMARATVPDVVADIGPVAGLVDRVMDGVGSATTLLPPGTSPHGAALRPSQARALSGADLFVWIGPDLSPGLDRVRASLAADAPHLALLDVPGTVRLSPRSLDAFAAGTPADADADGDHDAPDDDHAHDDHADEHAEHGAHAHEDDHADDHHHSGTVDPHAWLDPVNGAAWLAAIADALAGLDPDNAALYRANATAGAAELAALGERLSARLAPVADRPFLILHDSTHYFEDRFGLAAAGAVTLSDAAPPSAAHLAALRRTVADLGAACLLVEPQYDRRLVETLSEGTAMRIGLLDPLGSAIPPGPGAYGAFLDGIGTALAACLAPGT